MYWRIRRESRFARRIAPRDLVRPRKLALLLGVRDHTMLSYPRLASLYGLAEEIERCGIPGAYVECGVARGGSAGVVGTALARPGRELWLFDSWEGLPEPTEADVSYLDQPGEEGMAKTSQGDAEELLFERLCLDRNRVHLVEGWFQDTIPPRLPQIAPIALLHLDNDWYESTDFCLRHLYDLVSPGGYVVIDDYEYWRGCKLAVDTFLAEQGEPVELVHVGDISVYWRKPQPPQPVEGEAPSRLASA
jgi:O-methyltransferase